MKDVDGSYVWCSGGWIVPYSTDGFCNAIGALHHMHRHTGTYMDMCHTCFGCDPKDRHKGCPAHSGQPGIWRSGDVLKCQLFKDMLVKS